MSGINGFWVLNDSNTVNGQRKEIRSIAWVLTWLGLGGGEKKRERHCAKREGKEKEEKKKEKRKGLWSTVSRRGPTMNENQKERKEQRTWDLGTIGKGRVAN